MNRGAEGEGRRAQGLSSHFFAPGGFRGFTLIEVLLAVVILAIIMGVVYASFSTAGRNIDQAKAVRDETDLARTLMSRLCDDIGNAYYNPIQTQGSTLHLIFYGKKVEVTGESEADAVRHDSISLTTLTNWRKPNSKEMDLWEVGYSFKEKEDGTGYILVRREKRDLSQNVPALEGGVEIEITDRVKSLQLRYYDGSQWLDEWDSRRRLKLPSAVEITLMLDTGKVFMTEVDTGR